VGSEGVATGLFLGRVPYIRGGSGPRKAVVSFGGNALLKRLDRADARRRTGAIGAETMVGGLPADQFFDRGAFEETARLIPGARLEAFEGGRHMLPVERGRHVARRLADFLGGHR
jgi:pimeloyl-ACP methyl ester carboxylesterase